MTNADVPLDGLIALEPSPDEEAWEAYLLFALEQLGGEEKTAVEMKTLAALERAVGTQLPFEVGLLLVIGVPDLDGWRRWGDDPASDLDAWRAEMLSDILRDVECGFWTDAWGARPERSSEIHDVVRSKFAAAAPLLPLFGNRAIPLVCADGEKKAESNPVLAIDGTSVATVGTDLAAWLTNEFDVPLPMWPTTPERRFSFWSELRHASED